MKNNILTLHHILIFLGQSPRDVGAIPITGAAVDSRLIQPGNLFVAVPGEMVDGHDYLEHAFARGAAAALVQRDIPNKDPRCIHVTDTVAALQQLARAWRKELARVRVIGITGSVGKTTTKEIVAQVLSQRYQVLKNAGNLNNEIGLPLTLLHLTPKHERAILEMGLYKQGDIAFLCDIAKPNVGVITNVYSVHAERAGTLANIVDGKSELVRALPADGVAILNADQPDVLAMAKETRARVFTYGIANQDSQKPDLWASDIVGLGLEGIAFRLHYQGDVLRLTVPMLGRHSVQTALRAAAVGLVEGMAWEDIITGLQQANTQLRLHTVLGPRGSLLLDDTYNASPESTIAALNLLAEIPATRRIAVLGDMLELGIYTQMGHQMVAGRARDVADILVTVGELGKLISDSIRAHSGRILPLHHVPDQTTAAALLKELLQKGDVVLVKGSRALRLDRLVQQLEQRGDSL